MLIIFTFLLASCGHEPVGRDFEFDESKDYALLAYDLSFIGPAWPNYSFYLYPYNEEDGTINRKDRVEMGCGYMCEKGNEEVRFTMKPIKPGTYVVGYFYFQVLWQPTVLCYAEQTVKVDIEPGTIHYMGEMVVSMDYGKGVFLENLEVLNHDEEHVRKRLAKFPNVLEVNARYHLDGTPRAALNTAEPGKIIATPAQYTSFIRPEGYKANQCIRGHTN